MVPLPTIPLLIGGELRPAISLFQNVHIGNREVTATNVGLTFAKYELCFHLFISIE